MNVSSQMVWVRGKPTNIVSSHYDNRWLSDHEHTKEIRFCKCWRKPLKGQCFVFPLDMLWMYETYEVMFCYLHSMTKGVLCSVTSLSVVLIEWVQAAHLQGQDDPDHQVWNQGNKSKYVVTKNETDCGGIKNCDIFPTSCVEHFMYKSSPQLLCNTMYVKILGPNIFKGTCPLSS